MRAVSVVLGMLWAALIFMPEPDALLVAVACAVALLVVLAVFALDRRRRREIRGHVYLMGGHPAGIKIGRTNNLARRLNEHQTALPEAHYIVTLPARDPAALERRLHRMYATKRVWPDREYFRLSNADIRDIRRMA